jgi:hypothetical protein
MVVPSLKKFLYIKDKKLYIKRVVVNQEIYDIMIPEEQWSETNRKKINRFIKSNKLLTSPLPCNARATKVENGNCNNNQCQYCNKEFTTFSHKKRHTETCELENVTNIREYHDHSSTVNDHSTNNTTNNITNNNNTTNIHIHYNGNIQDFRKENPKWLTENVLRQLVLPKMEAIKRMIASKHFNEKFPENQNVRLNTRKDIDKYVQVYKGGKWRLSNTRDILTPMCIDLAEIISVALNGDFIEDFDDHSKKVLEEFRKSELYSRIEPKLKQFWENITTIIDDEKEDDLMDILAFLLIDKKLQDEQRYKETE